MEVKRINVVKAWPKPKSVQDVPVFIGFTNFDQRFIKSFSKIAAPLISILKTSPQPVGALPDTSVDNSKIVGYNAGNKGKSAKSDFTKPVRGAEETSFLTLDARRAFTQLRQAFTEAPILQHFDSSPISESRPTPLSMPWMPFLLS